MDWQADGREIIRGPHPPQVGHARGVGAGVGGTRHAAGVKRLRVKRLR